MKKSTRSTHKKSRHSTSKHTLKHIKKGEPRGFTIIEVMIVLAIAGLIMLIIFLAVPALQRNARNANRRNDVGLVIAYVAEYRSLNKGAWPSSCNTERDSHCFLRNVELNWYDNEKLNPSIAVGDNKNDVSFYKRTLANITADGGTPLYDPNDLDNKLSLRTYARCDGNVMTHVGASENHFAAEYTIETASGLILECREG